jgi:anti-sigma B factor antagonist
MESMDSMQITVSQMQGRVPVTVLHLKGRMNMGAADFVEQRAQDAIDQGARNLLLDLTDVVSLTSAGLRTIHVLARSMQAASADGKAATTPLSPDKKSAYLKLLNPSPDIRRVLNISGFDSLLEVFSDLQTAVASFG